MMNFKHNSLILGFFWVSGLAAAAAKEPVNISDSRPSASPKAARLQPPASEMKPERRPLHEEKQPVRHRAPYFKKLVSFGSGLSKENLKPVETVRDLIKKITTFDPLKGYVYNGRLLEAGRKLLRTYPKIN